MHDQEELPLFAVTRSPAALRKTAELIPFPLVRRRAYVARHAERMMILPAKTGEKHLAYQLRLQAETMAKRGFEPDVISHQVKSLEEAIRAEVWRKALVPGGAA